MGMQTFNAPDLKAPRFRPKVNNILNAKFIKKFKAKFPQYAHIPDKDLKKIVFEFNREICNTTIEERDGADLPVHLGTLFVGSCKSYKKDNVDFGNSRKHGKVIRHTNFATDGFISKIFYCNYAAKYKFRFRELYKFSACRDYSRSVSQEFPNKYEMYLQIDNTKQISQIFLKRQMRDKMTGKEDYSEYNEFDLK